MGDIVDPFSQNILLKYELGKVFEESLRYIEFIKTYLISNLFSRIVVFGKKWQGNPYPEGQWGKYWNPPKILWRSGSATKWVEIWLGQRHLRRWKSFCFILGGYVISVILKIIKSHVLLPSLLCSLFLKLVTQRSSSRFSLLLCGEEGCVTSLKTAARRLITSLRLENSVTR